MSCLATPITEHCKSCWSCCCCCCSLSLSLPCLAPHPLLIPSEFFRFSLSHLSLHKFPSFTPLPPTFHILTSYTRIHRKSLFFLSSNTTKHNQYSLLQHSLCPQKPKCRQNYQAAKQQGEHNNRQLQL
jgi:hypothetical protein